MNAKPQLDPEALRMFYTFFSERYSVHIKKDVEMLPAPWTSFEPLLNYKFTNVRREHDRQSKWLIANISNNSKLSLEEKIYNSILFRSWNKSETFDIFHGPFSMKSLTDNSFVANCKALAASWTETHPGYIWYTNAFNCGGLKAAWGFPGFDLYECTDSSVRVIIDTDERLDIPLKEAKTFLRSNPDAVIVNVVGFANVRDDFPSFEPCIPVRMFWLVRYAIQMNIADRVLKARRQEDAFDILREVRGFSNFLAYQVFVDLTYIPEFQFSENEFTVAGPGCQRGIDRLFKDRDGLSYEEALFYIRDRQTELFTPFGYDPKTLFSDLPDCDKSLNVMSLENLFCEFSKLMKIYDEKGHPRMRYEGKGATKGFF